MTTAARPLLADPRPRIVADGGDPHLAGVRCRACGHAGALRTPRCVRCGGEVDPALFGPAGTVWATTVVHVAGRPGDEVPYALAYVDLDEGPRLLTRLAGEGARVGDRVALLAATTDGDPAAELLR